MPFPDDPSDGFLVPGRAGASTYEGWLGEGNEGTFSEFLATLIGRPGKDSTVPGPEGLQGPPGPGTMVSAVRATDTQPRTFVVQLDDARCAIADPREPSHQGRIVGLDFDGGPAGTVAQITAIGPVSETGLTLDPGSPVYIGDGTTGRLGAPVGTPPATRADRDVWIQQVGTVAGATTLNIRLDLAYLLPASVSTTVIASDAVLVASAVGKDVVEAKTKAEARDAIDALDGIRINQKRGAEFTLTASDVGALPKTGGTVEGGLAAQSMRVDSAGVGAVTLIAGLADFTGYAEFRFANGTRAGFIGYAHASTKEINLHADQPGAGFNFTRSFGALPPRIDGFEILSRGTFDPASKLDKAGGRIEGDLSVAKGLASLTYTAAAPQAGRGSATLIAGQPDFTGYMEFINADLTRAGYVGYAHRFTKEIRLHAEQAGAVFNFTRSPGGLWPQVEGRDIFHPGNFDPTSKLDKTGGDITGPINLSGRVRASVVAADTDPIYQWVTSESGLTAPGGDGNFYVASAAFHHATNPIGHRERLHTELHVRGAATARFMCDSTSIVWGHTGKGSLFSTNCVVIIEPEMSPDTEASATEFNTLVKRDVVRKVNTQIVDVDGSGGRGTLFDAGILIGKQSGAFGYDNGLQIGDHLSAARFPVRGALIYSGVGVAQRGIDLRSTTLTSSHAALLRRGTRLSWAPDGTSAPTAGSVRSDATTQGMHVVLTDGQTIFNAPNEQNFLFVDSVATAVYPGIDAGMDLGRAGNRLRNVFASSGTIQTSDARRKQDVTDPEDGLLDAVGDVAIRLFRFRDAVAEKGDDARIHAGVIAQDLRDALAARGLDPRRYSVFCEDPDMESVEEIETVDEPVLRQVSYQETAVTMQDDGRAVIGPVTRHRTEPELEERLVFNPDGSPHMEPAKPARMAPARDKDGEPILDAAGEPVLIELAAAVPERQATIAIPKTRTIERTRLIERQKRAADGTPLTVLGVRYTELHALMLAWTRREIARLTEHVPPEAA